MSQEEKFLIFNQCIVQIRWKTLFEEIYKKHIEKPDQLTQEKFFRCILPSEFYNVLFDNPDKKTPSAQKNTRHRIFCASDAARKLFEKTKHYLLNQKNPKTGEHFTFSNFPLIEEIADNWKKLLEQNPEKLPETKECITDLLNEIPVEDELSIADRIGALCQTNDYGTALACLSLMASTLFYWGNSETGYEESDNQLHTLILPPLPGYDISYSLQKARTMIYNQDENVEEIVALLENAQKYPEEKAEAYFHLSECYLKLNKIQDSESCLNRSVNLGYPPAIKKNNQKKAQSLLKDAREIFENPESDNSAIKQCCNNCMKILNYIPAVDSRLRGEACFYIYKYSFAGNYALPSGESPYQYLEQSHQCQYEPAVSDWKNYNTFQLIPSISNEFDSGTGECIANCENELTTLFSKSIPKEWGEKLLMFTPEELPEKLQSDICRKFLFISDDFRQNLKDTLDLLQAIKTSLSLSSTPAIEIYLRAKEDTARPVIDTALSHMDDIILPIYILEDEKWAAQQLLSLHPLFYPIRSILTDANAANDQKEILHFIVSGDTLTAEWLVREAFWMMNFPGKNIQSKITLLAPDAEAVDAKIKTRFPGMAKSKVSIDGIDLPEISGKSINFDSNEMVSALENIYNEPNSHCYFAVATDNDEFNLYFAMKIRELLIRSTIEKRQENEFYTMPPIAFLCKDDYLAWTSKSMVIEVENFGNQWFNTWSLIPFGKNASRYVWDKINGGMFEDLAKCIHLQYSGTDPACPPAQHSKYQQAMHEYYRRQYNHDSSYAVALSMPYRLFQYHDKLGKNIIPLCWNILDDRVYSTPETLSNFAKRLSYLTHSQKKESEYLSLSKWEHERWVLWMLSRGWMPASPEDVVFACKCGNHRQQLFVARLHPCLCSYEKLLELSKILETECGMKKDFYAIDRTNIEMTKELLELKWLSFEHITEKENQR